ncbi:hypothetical protein [Clostridium cuniculi]|uniref:hypothetical protein n=1 Tax=Clostridium cuniculi TaxID=2548455 RepID=UPI001054BAD8|nr:hypothetical protein [Clostridium cuniculi]
MVEFKIRFKSGDVGYFKPTSAITIKQADELIEGISELIKNKATGTFKMLDLTDDKVTVINVREIVTFGYSLVAD